MSIENPKFIYSSSADRGLDTLLYLWQFIRKEFPEATLDVLYGFENWKKSILASGNEQQKQWMESIEEGLNQPGVTNHGRVSQDELAKYWQQMDIWAYPTRFTETYCITALEAQLYRTAIVTTRLAGLIDTVGDRGILIDGDAYTKEYREQFLSEVFAILRDDERREVMLDKAEKCAKKLTWSNRAKEWTDVFKQNGLTFPK